MQWLPAGDEQCSGSPCGTHQLPVMPWLLARHMPGSDSHQVRQGTTFTGDTRPAVTPGVARSACEAQDTCQSPVPRMAGTVSPQLPGDTQLPVGTGWRAQCTGPSALCSWRGAGAGQAVLGDRDTIAGLPVPPSGGHQALGATLPSAPGAGGAQTFPAWPASPTTPCFQQPAPPRIPAAARHVLPAPLPRSLIPGDCVKHHQGRDRGIYSRYSSLITSSPVLSSHWVFTLRGVSTESWSETHSSAVSCSLQKPLKPLL